MSVPPTLPNGRTKLKSFALWKALFPAAYVFMVIHTTNTFICIIKRLHRLTLLFLLVLGVVGVPKSGQEELDEDVLIYPPNDPYFSKQRMLFEALHINETWTAVRESGLDRRDVIVTTIDSGVATELPDLKGKLLKGVDVTGSPNRTVEDSHGHGTAMAAIIAAGINNNIDGAGIADKVKIRPIRVSATSMKRDNKAWEEAKTYKDSDIVLFAFGSNLTDKKVFLYKPLIDKAVRKGKFVVLAAANPHHPIGYSDTVLPCSLANTMPGVVCVAATLTSNPKVLESRSALLASFGVPGTDVWLPTLKHEGDKWKYKYGAGSSAAAAIVAGVAALMQSFGKFEPDEMKKMLLNATEGKVRTNDGVEMPYGVLRPDLAVKQAIEKAERLKRMSKIRRSFRKIWIKGKNRKKVY